MDNHFKHISASDKLKAETLKKAKHINWVLLPSIAAILVIMIGVSTFFIPEKTNDVNNAPENSLDNDTVKGESIVILEEDVKVGEGSVDYTTDISRGDEEKPSATSTPITKPIVTGIPIPVTTPSPTETPYISDGGLSAQVTERPAVYDEFIEANRETMYIIADNVAAHDRASTDAPIKFTIPKGAQVIADRNFKRIWAYVHYEENGVKKYGFVLEEYLSTEKP